jgi:hypothetical protein
VIWDLVLQPDPEGPTLISHTACHYSVGHSPPFRAFMAHHHLGASISLAQPHCSDIVHVRPNNLKLLSTFRVEDQAEVNPESGHLSVHTVAQSKTQLRIAGSKLAPRNSKWARTPMLAVPSISARIPRG